MGLVWGRRRIGKSALLEKFSSDKWSRRVNGPRLRWELERKVASLPNRSPDLGYAVCAREKVDSAEGVLAITAEEIFGG
ncbi:MAG: hypothetical protein ACREP9_10545 [Candidatus Dormibacteraceae bacterium]